MALPTNINTLLTGNVVEWARIEFKTTWDPEASLKTICAFANDLDNWGGGYIVIGVAEENGIPQKPLQGVPTDKIDTYQKDIYAKCKLIRPEYTPIIGVEEFEGIVSFPEGEGGNQIVEEIFRGPIQEQLRSALRYIRNMHITEKVIKHPDRAEADRFFNYPYVAIEEAGYRVFNRRYRIMDHPLLYLKRMMRDPILLLLYLFMRDLRNH